MQHNCADGSRLNYYRKIAILCDVGMLNNVQRIFLENFVIRLNFHQGQNGAAVVI